MEQEPPKRSETRCWLGVTVVNRVTRKWPHMFSTLDHFDFHCMYNKVYKNANYQAVFKKVHCQTNTLLDKNSCHFNFWPQKKVWIYRKPYEVSKMWNCFDLALVPVQKGPGNVPFNKSTDNGKWLQTAPCLLDLCCKCTLPPRYLSKSTTVQ